MTRPVRRRLPSGKKGSAAPPARPKRIKARYKALLLLVVAIIALALYESNRRTSGTGAGADRSDLGLVPSRIQVAAGRTGTVQVRIVNHGPDRLDDHTVTFTVTTPRHLIITGGGTILGDSEQPFPDDGCRPRGGGHAMTCRADLDLGTSGRLLWRIPVRTDVTTPANASLRLTVSAAGSTSYVDPHRANNTRIAFTVLAGRAASPGKHAARDALAPVTIALWSLVGLVVLIVAGLVFVARRRRHRPLDGDIDVND